jgi:hypothetical protein
MASPRRSEDETGTIPRVGMIFPQSANHAVNLLVDACAAFPSSMIDQLRFVLAFPRISSLAIVNVRIDRPCPPARHMQSCTADDVLENGT